MPSTILINAATGAVSPEFTVSPEQERFTIRASGLAGAETITLQVQVGGEFRNENEDDVAITLTATAQTVILNAPGASAPFLLPCCRWWRMALNRPLVCCMNRVMNCLVFGPNE